MMRALENKKIVAGICGGIAAYKAAGVVSKLVQEGAEVRVVMTHGAKQFVTPLTFEALTHTRVLTDVFHDDPLAHVELAHQTDLFIIMPATYHVVGKLACGLADDMLTTTLAATRAPVLVVPAMESQMYTHPIYQENQRKLEKLGYRFLEPESGPLASGRQGIGRFPAEEKILRAIERVFEDHTRLSGLTILITAGPTREMIDPMRCITNKSSGRMGFALAEAASVMGAEKVLLVSGPTELIPSLKANIIRVESAEEMQKTVLAHASDYRVVIMAAAVADWRPKQIAKNKIKKRTMNTLTIELEKTADILDELGRSKRSNQILVGFAAESDQLIENAKKKLKSKHLDLMVANSLLQRDAGPEAETNQVTLLYKDGRCEALPLLHKREVAREILTRVARLLEAQ
jgi:phosphopantothenoylcysteine decarboxylase/phosphopantothenate--cysteine ligase